MTAAAPADPVVAYLWEVPGADIDSHLERVRAHCRARGWRVASELRAARFPELTELIRRVGQREARYLILTREALADLERRFPDAWRGVQARIETRGVTIVAV